MSFLQQLYSLDTLDTRFTTSSSTPPKPDGNASEARSPEKNNDASGLPPGASPSRWNTPEFYLYALVHLLAVPSMFKAVIDVSQRKHDMATHTLYQLTGLKPLIPDIPNSPGASPRVGSRVAKWYV